MALPPPPPLTSSNWQGNLSGNPSPLHPRWAPARLSDTCREYYGHPVETWSATDADREALQLLTTGAIPAPVAMTHTDYAATVGERYWLRAIAVAGPGEAEETVTKTGAWAAGHITTVPARPRWTARVALTAGREAPLNAVLDGAGLIHMARPLPPEAPLAVLLYGAGRLLRPDTATQLGSWLTDSTIALTTPTEALPATRPLLAALRTWAGWWTPTAPAAQLYAEWALAWDTGAHHDPLTAEVLLSALASPHHLAPGSGHLLAEHDRLLTHTRRALELHPASHQLHGLHGQALTAAGDRRAARRAYRAALALLPDHDGPGVDLPRTSYRRGRP